MNAAARPVTDEQREAARVFVDKQAPEMALAFGYVTLRRYDNPQPHYGIHKLTGMQVVRRPDGTIRRAAFKSDVVGLFSPLICDEFLARYRYENPLVSTLQWRHMSPSLRGLIADASILPMEWKYSDVLNSDWLDDRVRITAVTPVLRFFQA